MQIRHCFLSPLVSPMPVPLSSYPHFAPIPFRGYLSKTRILILFCGTISKLYKSRMTYRVAGRVQRKPLKSKLKPSIPIARPVKESTKPRVTISTSNILRRKPMKEVYGKKHSRRHGLPEPQGDLFLDYQGKSQLVISPSKLHYPTW
jgi:hypothetical protein